MPLAISEPTIGPGVSLACINFIKSSLKIDSFSDGSQDIDLVSQEILITDSRFSAIKPQLSSTMPKNYFTNILQPINFIPGTTSVQAEVHSRRRKDASKYTILLNNMRLMAILDWLESVRDFLSHSAPAPKDPAAGQRIISGSTSEALLSPPATVDEPLELVLNITDSELVFVERPDQWDTNAVILKSTTVVSYRPAETNKVMSINLNHLEVFSCILGNEEETALSIIDPVTVNLDLRRNTLDIQLQRSLCVRLSYHDVRMFIQMLESLPRQTRHAKASESPDIEQAKISKLIALGFIHTDCMKALKICDYELDDAALWLTQNAEPIRHQPLTVNPLDINAVHLRAHNISICVIDDCKDADVPLLELSLTDLDITQDTAELRPGTSGGGTFKAGSLKGKFSSDYYNRALSGWEPLIEPWNCSAAWSYSLGSGMQRNRLHLRVSSDDILKLNVTTTIVDLYQLVHSNWTQDYYGAASAVVNPSGSLSPANNKNYRQRIPFVPFAIKNQTGVKLWFTTLVSEPGSGVGGMLSAPGTSRSTDLLNQADTRWTAVEPGAVKTFSFAAQTKQRHLDSHKMNFHQVGVRVEGWTEVGPVSVDRVGVFFRHARHDNDEFISMPRTRIVFSVTLEGSAHKLVTVRSALQLHNKLNNQMLLKMDHFFGHLNISNWPKPITAIVPSNETYNVPLTHVHSFLFLRPLPTEIAYQPIVSRALTTITESPDTSESSAAVVKFNGNDYWNQYEGNAARNPNSTSSYQFCAKSIHWKDMDDGIEVHQVLRTCKGNSERWFRFVAAIKREGFPAKDAAGIPGHSIAIYPPLRLNNLLPCDLLYKLPTGTQGRVSTSETANVHDVDLDVQLEITLTLDGYPKPAPITVPSGLLGTVETNLRLTDVMARSLNLRITISVVRGSGMQISVSAPFWLVNRTGLPLVFRQEGVSHDSAGQFGENEMARLVSPLMYSIADPDASSALTMRLGKRYGTNPPWCQPFSLHKDIINRQLRSVNSNETFIIGIDVRRGRGRYSKTSVITFSPRFQLYNRSSYKLQFAQKCFATIMVTEQFSFYISLQFKCKMFSFFSLIQWLESHLLKLFQAVTFHSIGHGWTGPRSYAFVSPKSKIVCGPVEFPFTRPRVFI